MNDVRILFFVLNTFLNIYYTVMPKTKEELKARRHELNAMTAEDRKANREAKGIDNVRVKKIHVKCCHCGRTVGVELVAYQKEVGYLQHIHHTCMMREFNKREQYMLSKKDYQRRAEDILCSRLLPPRLCEKCKTDISYISNTSPTRCLKIDCCG